MADSSGERSKRVQRIKGFDQLMAVPLVTDESINKQPGFERSHIKQKGMIFVNPLKIDEDGITASHHHIRCMKIAVHHTDHRAPGWAA